MIAFGPEAGRTIADFAGRLGLPNRPATDGSYSFAFASSGQLCIAGSQDGTQVIVSLSRRPRHVDGAALERVLAVAGSDPASGRLTRVGLSGDGGIHLCQAINQETFDLVTLEACIRHLMDLHDSVA